MAAGNTGVPLEDSIAKIADTNPNILAVSGVDSSSAYWKSNSGASVYGAVLIAAPSFEVYSDVVGGGYDNGTTCLPGFCFENGNASGTSLAAPHVTGVAGLMLSVNPDLTPSQMKNILLTSAHDTGNQDPGKNEVMLLDAYAAVSSAQSARTTTYSFASVQFKIFNSGTSCPPTCQIEGYFTVPQPLPPNINLPVGVIDGSGTFRPTSFCFTNGVDTITNANATISGFAVNTDSNGNIVQWGLYAENSAFYVWANYFPQIDSQVGFSSNSGGVFHQAYFEDGLGKAPTGTWSIGSSASGCGVPPPVL